MLNSLPSVTAKAQRVGRNNDGGSSSFSVLTGQETLEPSISTERYRNTQQLNVEWNLLDAGINLWRAKSTSDRMLIAQALGENLTIISNEFVFEAFGVNRLW